MKKVSLLYGAVSSAALLVMLTGCDLEDFFGINTGGGDVALTGQNAFVHIAPELNSSVAVDMAAVQEVFAAGEGAPISEEAGDLLRSSARRRNNLDPEAFQLLPPEELVVQGEGKAGINLGVMVWDTPDLASMPAEYTIPRAGSIPMRNQQNRGTCAAFAGMAGLEYAILRDYPEVATIDFSEQKFYYNSKPECQATGCGASQGGSAYYTGFYESMYGGDFDIPLEVDCAYNGQQTSNELQTPLASGCFQGAAQIVEFQTLNSISEIVDALDDGYAVTWASPLSENWMYPNRYNQNGLITYADAGSQGDGRHAGGHAYTIVGYRKLPSMPGEGGMCFIVKNSWGAGWGVNGFGCMTTKWMQAWAYENYAPAAIVTSYNVRSGILPDASVDPNDEPWDNLPDYDDPDDETIDRGRDDNVVIPDAVDDDSRAWTTARLRGPDGRWYRAVMAEGTGTLAVRGRLRNTGRETGTLEIRRSGDVLSYNGEQVGTVSGNEITLCTGAWDPVCGLRFNASQNELYIEFLYPEYRQVRAEQLSGGQWTDLSLGSGGLSFEFYRPSKVKDFFTSPVYIRANSSEASSDPIRLAIGKGLSIRAMGRTIGSLKPGEMGLCSGAYRSQCSLYNADGKLLFMPN